jgi:hypothetical protein
MKEKELLNETSNTLAWVIRDLNSCFNFQRVLPLTTNTDVQINDLLIKNGRDCLSYLARLKEKIEAALKAENPSESGTPKKEEKESGKPNG